MFSVSPQILFYGYISQVPQCYSMYTCEVLIIFSSIMCVLMARGPWGGHFSQMHDKGNLNSTHCVPTGLVLSWSDVVWFIVKFSGLAMVWVLLGPHHSTMLQPTPSFPHTLNQSNQPITVWHSLPGLSVLMQTN
jgi:hypothetical protein